MRTESRVTFVNTNQIKPAIAPIAFDYLSAPLEARGFELDMLDLCFEDDIDKAVREHCSRRAPRYWAVTLRNTDDVYYASGHSFLEGIRRIIQSLRAACPAPIIMGGAGFSVMPDRLLRYLDADFGVAREGEFTFPELLRCLEDGRDFSYLPALVYWAGGVVRETTRHKSTCGRLDELGPRKREIVDNHHYFAKGGQIGIETKRGCNRRCIYCVEPMIKGQSVRLRPVPKVVDEMETLVARGINVFHINDSEFNLSVSHPIALCREIIDRRLEHRMSWYAYGMPKPFPFELAAAMKEAGCAGMNFGVDTASPKMLKILRRTFAQEDIAHAIQAVKRYQLDHVVELLFGAPGETQETVRETIDFIKSLDPQRVAVTVGLRIFPNTELEQMIRKEGLHAGNPNLQGAIEGNEELLEPVFYIPQSLGPDPQRFVADLIGDDTRFFGANDELFNYNANDALVRAIEAGERGAYWSILHRIEQRYLAAEARVREAGQSLVPEVDDAARRSLPIWEEADA